MWTVDIGKAVDEVTEASKVYPWGSYALKCKYRPSLYEYKEIIPSHRFISGRSGRMPGLRI